MSLTQEELNRLDECGTFSPMVGEENIGHTPSPIKNEKTNKGETNMTTSNENVVKAEMTENALKAKAASVGYRPIYNNTKCPVCNHKLFKFNKSNQPYIIACTCGYRKVVAKQEFKNGVTCSTRGCRATLCKHDTDGICTNCRNEIAGGGNPHMWSEGCLRKPKSGCFHYIQGGDDECARVCGIINKPAPEKKSERLCKCGNPLPADRKQRCYSCQPQSKRAKAAAKKEPAQQRVDM